MSTTFRVLPNYKWGVTRWSVVRCDGFIMGVFHSRGQAAEYCARKNAEAAQ